MTPSEILEDLRNDGWSTHHREEFRKRIDDLAERVALLKIEIFNDFGCLWEQVGCA